MGLTAMDSREFATRDEVWRIQEALNDLSAVQALHSERIMRLEQKAPDGSRSRSLWGSASPFPLGSSHQGKPTTSDSRVLRRLTWL
jgi:hypothetical protein